ncbi:replication initiator protein [Capybara microvirus Cap1_SP_90]|nr:replication initiator protein [Capybara microvirus Cap1_SP_90]
MCYNPRVIRNPTKDLVPTDALQITVSCGECEECRNHRRNEMVFRTYEQMLEDQKKGYIQCFFTLTYNDDCLPHFKCSSYNIPCFSPDDISAFRGHLQDYLLDRYGIKSSTYLICAEYGSNTQRPHYHCYFACPSKGVITPRFTKKTGITSESNLPVLTGSILHSIVKECWTYGFLFPRFPQGGRDSTGYNHKPFVLTGDVTGAAKYIAKYVCKDLALLERPDVQQFIAEFKNKLNGKHDIYKKFQKVSSLMRCSQGFGKCICDKVKSVDDIKNGVTTNLYPTHKIAVPQYIVRKLTRVAHYIKEDASGFKYLKPKVRYELTEFGKEVYKESIKHQIKNLTKSLHDWNPSIDAQSIATYAVVYRNRMNPRHSTIKDAFTCELTSADFFTGLESLSRMMSKALPYKFAHLDYVKLPQSPLVNDDVYYHLDLGYRFNDFKCFEGFDDIYDSYVEYNNKKKKENLELKAAHAQYIKSLKEHFSHTENNNNNKYRSLCFRQ